MIVRVIDWSKQVLHVITTTCHGPHLAICRVRGQDEVTTSHFPRSLHTIAYHDLCQPPVRWWWSCHHLVSSWQHKISPHHWRDKQCFWNCIYKAFTNKEKVSWLYLVKGQLIYLSLSEPWLTKPSEGASGRLLQVERLNQESILVEIVRPSIWQLRGLPGTWGLNSTHLALACKKEN